MVLAVCKALYHDHAGVGRVNFGLRVTEKLLPNYKKFSQSMPLDPAFGLIPVSGCLAGRHFRIPFCAASLDLSFKGWVGRQVGLLPARLTPQIWPSEVGVWPGRKTTPRDGG
jgi:hypothetical protein